MRFTFRLVVDNAYCHAFVHGRSDRDDSQDVNLRQVNGRILTVDFNTLFAEKIKLGTIPQCGLLLF